MIALLSALLGFASSIVPKFFEIKQDASDKAHELKMLEMQAQFEQTRADRDLEKSIAAAVASQNVATQESYRADIDANKTRNPWVTAYSATVRPTITYAFFLLYAVVKGAQFWLLIHPELPWQTASTVAQAMVGIWGEEDMAIFSAVIAFWFGDRMIRRR